MAYLYTADNPHSRVRANGRRGWYYPTRAVPMAQVRLIVLHTAETAPSPASALNVARWQRDTASAPSSYHRLVDSGRTVVTLPDKATAFHVVGYNTISLGLSFATYAAWWGRYPEWDDAALRRGAAEIARWCRAHEIRPWLRTRREVDAGRDGITFHSRLDPDRRSDPGRSFPIDELLGHVGRLLNDEPEPIMDDFDLTGLADALDRAADNNQAAAQVAVARYLGEARAALGKRVDPTSDALWAVRLTSPARTETLEDAVRRIRDDAPDA